MGRAVIFDIETVGESFDGMDELTKREFEKRFRHQAASDDEFEALLAEAVDRMALSPLTGQIAAIGVLNVGGDKGAVYYQSPGVEQAETSVGAIKLIALPSEAEMLRRFWGKAMRGVDTVVGFNSRSFDAWWLHVRSAAHRIRPPADLLSARYLYQQKGVKHVDLKDQLEAYGAARGGSLHMWCRALGIKSPKSADMSGSEVGRAFAEKRFLDIALYNAEDLVAELELYRIWRDFFNFQPP